MNYLIIAVIVLIIALGLSLWFNFSGFTRRKLAKAKEELKKINQDLAVANNELKQAREDYENVSTDIDKFIEENITDENTTIDSTRLNSILSSFRPKR